jgi:cation diffusion facilitator family transporter
MASIGILLFLLLVVREVVGAAWHRILSGHQAPTITPLTYAVMGGTFAINLAVMLYERRAGRRLGSEVLVADSHHTMSDLLTSVTVIAALIGVQLGYTWLDPAAALLVAAFIAYACWEIFNSTTDILADRVVMREDEIRAVVASVPEVIGCHHIRTRGSADFVFLDLHVWLDPEMRLERAHTVSHQVKDKLMAAFPQIKDAIIHIEPPPRKGSGPFFSGD